MDCVSVPHRGQAHTSTRVIPRIAQGSNGDPDRQQRIAANDVTMRGVILVTCWRSMHRGRRRLAKAHATFPCLPGSAAAPTEALLRILAALARR